MHFSIPNFKNGVGVVSYFFSTLQMSLIISLVSSLILYKYLGISNIYKSKRVPTKKIRDFAVLERYKINRTETIFREGLFLVLVLLKF